MQHLIRSIILAALGGLLFVPLSVAQAPVLDSANLNARLQRLERSLSGSSLLQLAQSLQELQREVRELRGELEVQSRDISRLRSRQRDLYLDLDKRLLAIETRATSAAPPAIPGGGIATAPAASAPGVPAVPAPAGAAPTTPAINAAVPPTAAPGSAQATPPNATPGVAQGVAPGAVQAPSPPLSSIDPAAEQQAYRDAFELLKNGKYDLAGNALLGFLKDYPNGRFADNAQYWLGETYYVNRKFDPALAAFERLLVDYPDSTKRSHAMLKIGFIHDEAGRQQDARQVLTKLIQLYPQSTAAGLAKKRLSRLQ